MSCVLVNDTFISKQMSIDFGVRQGPAIQNLPYVSGPDGAGPANPPQQWAVGCLDTNGLRSTIQLENKTFPTPEDAIFHYNENPTCKEEEVPPGMNLNTENSHEWVSHATNPRLSYSKHRIARTYNDPTTRKLLTVDNTELCYVGDDKNCKVPTPEQRQRFIARFEFKVPPPKLPRVEKGEATLTRPQEPLRNTTLQWLDAATLFFETDMSSYKDMFIHKFAVRKKFEDVQFNSPLQLQGKTITWPLLDDNSRVLLLRLTGRWGAEQYNALEDSAKNRPKKEKEQLHLVSIFGKQQEGDAIARTSFEPDKTTVTRIGDTVTETVTDITCNDAGNKQSQAYRVTSKYIAAQLGFQDNLGLLKDDKSPAYYEKMRGRNPAYKKIKDLSGVDSLEDDEFYFVFVLAETDEPGDFSETNVFAFMTGYYEGNHQEVHISVLYASPKNHGAGKLLLDYSTGGVAANNKPTDVHNSGFYTWPSNLVKSITLDSLNYVFFYAKDFGKGPEGQERKLQICHYGDLPLLPLTDTNYAFGLNQYYRSRGFRNLDTDTQDEATLCSKLKDDQAFVPSELNYQNTSKIITTKKPGRAPTSIEDQRGNKMTYCRFDAGAPGPATAPVPAPSASDEGWKVFPSRQNRV